MFTLLTVICLGNELNSCTNLILDTFNTKQECEKVIEIGIEKIQMPDGNWYSAEGLVWTCAAEV